MKLTTV